MAFETRRRGWAKICVHFRDGWMLLIGEAALRREYGSVGWVQATTAVEGSWRFGIISQAKWRRYTIHFSTSPATRLPLSFSRTLEEGNLLCLGDLSGTVLHKAEDHRSATSSPRNWSPRWWKRFNMSPLWMFAWLSLLKSSLFFSALIVLDASMFACARPCAALRFELFYWTPRAFNFPFSAI